MAYRFNSISGKIVGGAAQRIGQGIRASAPAEAPQIIFESQKIKFPTIASATKPRRPGVGEVPPELLQKYKHYQVDNNVPIHLKGGTTDMVLYYATLVGCAVGIVECFRYYYSAAFPKKA
ncbi:unnamed protein product [Orchesella dallaii]|uniref:Uncharacterized protein n=1 Tax=Orchesella dallaii TaxID=48710 RepID=A0ABP1QSX6_9HEXA